MVTLASLIVGPITQIGQWLFPPVLRRIRYVVRLSKYVEKLRRSMEELTTRTVDVQRSVDAARRKGEVIKTEVEDWLNRVNVDLLQTEVNLLHDAVQQNRGCLQGTRGCFVRYRAGKEAVKKITFIVDLRNEGQFTTVSDPTPPPGIESEPTPKDFVIFQSTELAMKEITKALEDKKINLVGVYGMGGVGKTTLMKELGKTVIRDGLFHHVVMVTVSQHPVVKNIQRDIAEDLGMGFVEESESIRGRRLLQRLKQEKGVLVVLDDLWDPLDLANIGIPFGDESCKQCKIVLTTRSLDVCTQMLTQKEVEVHVLIEADAWSLLQKNAGVCIDSPALYTVAQEVAKECGGLPIALITLGRALRNKDPTVWADAARRLKRSTAREIPGMEAKVFSSIKLSYDYLDSEEIRFCFLLCCLFPEDYKISENDLFPYVIGERIFKDVESLMETRDQLHTVLDKLQASCLLLKGEYDGRVKMHDVVRDVAIEIARKDHGFEVKAGRGLEQWLDMENLERCKRLSLMHNKIKKLTNMPGCSQLVTLSLQDNGDMEKIPDKFFEGMTSLTTLDFSDTIICSLPPSISCLTNLRILNMSDWEYPDKERQPLDISMLGNLKKLEMLNLSGRYLCSLPEEIGGLTKLKFLGLDGSGDGSGKITIPPNVVSQLSCLEELDMYDSFDKWEIEGGSTDTGNAYFSEVASLADLTNLRLDISNVECLSACIPICWKKLTQFSIKVGNIATCQNLFGKGMSFSELVFPEQLSDLFKMLFQWSENLHFKRCKGLKNMWQVVKECGSFNRLKSLTFEDCDNLEYLLVKMGHVLSNLEFLNFCDCHGMTEIFNFEGLGGEGQAPLMKVQELKLTKLPKLETIWKGVIPHGSLQSVVKICINYLPRLKYLFSPPMVERLQKLECLGINWCNEMVQIISSNEEGKEQTVGADLMEQCTTTTSTQHNLSNLVSTMNYFHNLKILCIHDCCKLKYFLPLNLGRYLLHLKDIDISLCCDIEEIFTINGETNDEGVEQITWADPIEQRRVTTLPQSSLSNLLSNPNCFQNLRSISVGHCPKLKYLLPLNLGRHLEVIEILYCNNMEEIFASNGETDEGMVTLPKLSSLTLVFLPKLLGLVTFSPSQSRDPDLLVDFPSLHSLSIEQCPNLKRGSLDSRPTKKIKYDGKQRHLLH